MMFKKNETWNASFQLRNWCSAMNISRHTLDRQSKKENYAWMRFFSDQRHAFKDLLSIQNMLQLKVNLTCPKIRIFPIYLVYKYFDRPYIYKQSWFFRFDGLLVSVVGIIGFVGNSLALLVLSRPSLRDVFHQLLFALACFDILYIVCGGVNYTFK